MSICSLSTLPVFFNHNVIFKDRKSLSACCPKMNKIAIKKVNYVATYITYNYMFCQKAHHIRKKMSFCGRPALKINVNPEAQYMCIHITFKKIILGINVSIKTAYNSKLISKKWQKYTVVQFQP